MPKRPFLTDWKKSLASLLGDAQRFLRDHCELARLEANETARALTGVVVLLVTGACLFLLAIPLVTVGFSLLLAEVTQISIGGWLVLFAIAYAVLGAWAVVTGVRRWRHDVRFFEETREALHDDGVWLADLFGQAPSSHPASEPGSTKTADETTEAVSD